MKAIATFWIDPEATEATARVFRTTHDEHYCLSLRIDNTEAEWWLTPQQITALALALRIESRNLPEPGDSTEYTAR